MKISILCRAAAAALLCALPMLAQVPVGYVQVTGSTLTDSSGVPVANATIAFAPVNNSGQAIGYQVNGKGQAITSPVTTLVTAGAFSIRLADTTLTAPVNVCFSVTVQDNVSGKSYLGPGYTCFQPAGYGTAVSSGMCTAATSTVGGTCNFDSFQPNLPGLVVQQTGPAGPAGPAGPVGPPGGSLSYPGVTTDNANGLAITGGISVGARGVTYSDASVQTKASGWLTGIGPPTQTCSSTVNIGFFYTTNTQQLYQCFNVSGNYQWQQLTSSVIYGTTAGTAAQGNDPRFQALTSGILGYSTQAAMNADLAHPAGTLAAVTNDPTTALNGSYSKQGASGSGSWLQAIDRTAAVQAQVNKIQVTNLNTPGTNPDTPTQYIGRYAPVGNYPSNNKTWCEASATAPFSGYVSSFNVSLTGVDAGRTVNFYIVTNNGSGSFTATYDSGPISMTVAGTNTYTLPDFTTASITAGQTICAYIHATTTATLLGFYAGGGNLPGAAAYFLSTGAMTVGTPATLTADSLRYWYAMNAVVIDRDIYVAKRWANKPGGYAQPDITSGKIQQQLLPTYLVNANIPQTATNSTQANVWDANLTPYSNQTTVNKVRLAPTTVTSVQDFTPTWNAANPGAPVAACGPISDASSLPTGYPQGRVVIAYNTQMGFAVSGILNRVRFYPATASIAGSYINVWVIHPVTPPPSIPLGTGTYNFVVIAQAGTIDGSQAGLYQELTGLNIAVSAGDMIAFQPVGRGLQYASSSTTCNNNYAEISLTGTGTTLDALPIGQVISGSGTVLARQHLYTTEVIPGPAFVSANVPGGMLRLDSNGDIPVNLGRAVDTFWRGKKIIWVGTSIPASYGNADVPPDSIPSYPVIVGQNLQASMDNESVGSSGIVWNSVTPRCLTLMATIAQLTSGGCAANVAQSYQNKIVGKHVDMLVIDHGHNDIVSPGMTVTGTINDNATATAYSASGGTLTITAANNFTNGQTIVITAASTDALAPIDGLVFTVLASPLSATQFAISTGAVTGSGSTKATAFNNATFYGAYQGMIAVAYNDNLLMRIVLVTPPKSPDRGYVPPLDMTATRTAIFAIAAKWQLPVVDLQANDGFNDTNYCTGGLCPIYTADGIHPQGYARQILARILYQAIRAF